MKKGIAIIIAVLALVAVCLSAVALVLTLQADRQGGEEPQETQYVLYLGTNDKDTNEPVFSPDQARTEAERILIRHFGGYTIQEAHGGWEDGGLYYQEYTIVIYLSDTTLDKVHAAADEMISTFHQSSVLIQANRTATEFYGGAE